MIRVLWTILFATLAAPAPVRGADSQPADPVGPSPDSASTLSRLERLQREFETFRRRQLPWTDSQSGHCDIRIGIYCFTASKTGPWRSPAAPPGVVERRSRLIDALASAADTFPGEAWITGQTVRYLVEAGRVSRAQQRGVDCAPVSWWCATLAGFAFHDAGDIVRAEEYFTRGLDAMPDSTRCAWLDLSEVLNGRLRSEYRKRDCQSRDSLEARVLWLADPFWSNTGNEFLTEHLSRRVRARLLDDAGSVERRWRRDERRILLRYGWPLSWKRARPRMSHIGPPNIVSTYSSGARHFLPEWDYVLDPSGVELEEWDVHPERPHTQVSVGYGAAEFRPFDDLRMHVFPRGDSAAVVALFRMNYDSIPAESGATAGIVVSQDPVSRPHLVTRRFTGPEGRLMVVVPAVPAMVSVEMAVDSSPRAARSRSGLGTERLGLEIAERDRFVSDVLGLPRRDMLPERLEQAVDRAMLDPTFGPGDPVDLYWEIFRPGAAPETIAARLLLERRSRGLFRRIAELTPFASNDPERSLEWTDVVRTPWSSHAVTLELPADLRDGRYAVRLLVTFSDGERVERRYEFDVAGA